MLEAYLGGVVSRMSERTQRMRARCSRSRDLHVAYGKVEAVHDVSLTSARGSIVTVIGPNGAGKTTLLRAIDGPAAGAAATIALRRRRRRAAGRSRSASRAASCWCPRSASCSPR